MSEACEEILYVLSGRGKMRWSSFKATFNSMLRRRASSTQPTSTEVVPKWALLNCVRSLECLGHADFDFDRENAVVVAPPVLARLPRAGLAVAVLTGARTPDFIENVREEAKRINVRVSSEPPTRAAFGVPSSVFFEAISTQRLADLSKALGVRLEIEPPAWQLAHYARSVDEYLGSLEWLPATEPDWIRYGYDPSTLSFSGLADSGMRLKLSRHEVHGRWSHALWRDGLRASAHLDWARYSIARDLSIHLVAYDPKTLMFVACSAAPVPKPLCRALALCSGHAPRRVSGTHLPLEIVGECRQFELYEGVPHDVAQLVAAKLGQELVLARIRRGELKDG